MMRRAGSLFTGTAALDMAAAEIFGVPPAWFADLDPGAIALLTHHYPDVPNLGDITKVDWDLVAKLAWVYVLTLGWPCQPFSLAGKRKGADDERALWPECERAIRALRPRYLLLENVPAVVAAGELERVATSLATLRYRFAWVCLPAAAVGAPHIRERFFLLAVAEDADGAAPGQTEGRRARADARRRGRVPAADPAREHERAVAAGDRRGQPEEPARNRGALAADPARDGREQGRPESARVEGRPDAANSDRVGVRKQPVAVAARGSSAVVEQPGADAAAHSDGDERERQPVQQRGEAAAARDRDRPDWAGYAPAIHRWERVLGRPAPAPTVLSEQYLRRLARHEEAVRRRLAGEDPRPVGMRGSLLPPTPGYVLNPALPEWMMGLPGGWITSVPGLSRAQQLKLAGNGVVPQQAVAAYRYLLDVLERDGQVAA